MTSEKSVTRKRIILGRRPLVNISAEGVQSEELRKSRIREEHIVIPEINEKAKRILVRTDDTAAPWYFTHA